MTGCGSGRRPTASSSSVLVRSITTRPPAMLGAISPARQGLPDRAGTSALSPAARRRSSRPRDQRSENVPPGDNVAPSQRIPDHKECTRCDGRCRRIARATRLVSRYGGMMHGSRPSTRWPIIPGIGDIILWTVLKEAHHIMPAISVRQRYSDLGSRAHGR